MAVPAAPMLATLAESPETQLSLPGFVYEPKYDGIRALVVIEPAPRRDAQVRLWSRLGNEKTTQFPEAVAALARFGRALKAPIVVDGELVALDAGGEPAGFQRLQGRIHLTRGADIARVSGGQPVAFIAFDLIAEGDEDLRSLPFTERRRRLSRVFGRSKLLPSEARVGVRAELARPDSLVRLSEVATDGRALYARARAHDWEGLIAKRADSPYRSGKRSPDWLKIKLVKRQEFVVGGWTDPRSMRTHFGALLLGVYDGQHLKYTGHSGSGFTQAELERVWKTLKPLETPECPFAVRPRTNQKPHWVLPKVVAEVKFTEWTSDGFLRHPIYVGLRDDKDPRSVRREMPSMPPPATRSTRSTRSTTPGKASLSSLVEQIRALEDAKRDGVITLPDGATLSVTNLTKVFWPTPRLTKGDLMRYYVEVSPFLLPAIQDRPLVMKRLPHGISGKTFYQQRAPDAVPSGIRVERVSADREVPSRLVGGSLLTLLYMTQLAAISTDPWFSRVQSPTAADHAAFDLDPMPGVPFARVLDVARWIRDELEMLGVPGVAKSSGADGLHIHVPLPPETPYEAGMLFCQIVATIVAHKHPRITTVERAVRSRGKTVYIDYLQNILGKTLATAYSARASEFAGASTPFTWKEIDEGIDPRDFTIKTLPDRLNTVGDLWARLRTGKTADLTAVLKYAEPPVTRGKGRSS